MEQRPTCLLCNTEDKLFESHILPAFVFRWMKQAGPIRHSKNVNKRVQDGAKEHWLCERCEARFSSFETPFASRIFHPFDADRNVKVRYHEWLLKFCTSVSWRSLHLLRIQTDFSEFSELQRAMAHQALATWGKYLRGEYKHIGRFEQHLIPFVEIESEQRVDLPTNINRYLTRTTEINASTSPSTCFVYSKLGPFAVLGFIDVQKPQRWKDARIDKQGWFGSSSYRLPAGFKGFLIERANRMQSIAAKLSAAQQAKVQKLFLTNPHRYFESGVFRAMQRDIELFGKNAFAQSVQDKSLNS